VLGLALLVSCARVDFLLRDRTRRAYQRARTYLALRGDPVLRAEALEEIRSLRDEAAALDAALTRASVTA
jgi:phage shock protein A